MRIVHFSDWHWDFWHLPEADLYVCTGDMLPNYTWPVYSDVERTRQEAAVTRLLSNGGFRQFLGSPDAPVVCVRGNHDFIDLGRMFQDCNLVHEFKSNEVVEVLGLKVTGHRGIPYIAGTWNDETMRPDLYDRWYAMRPDADLYLTHYPADDMLDGAFGAHFGLEGVQNWFYYKCTTRYPVHLFGHVHECGGQVLQSGDVTFSNAAERVNVLDGSPSDGWISIPCEVERA